MNAISKLVHFLSISQSRDRDFESYYGALARSRYGGGPTASEARRDYDIVRRTTSRAAMY